MAEESTQKAKTGGVGHEALIGRVFDGRFKIGTLLGRGGMGAVYRAQQLSMDKAVALKVLSKHLAEEEKQVQRFKQEALTSSQLKHPNTIRVIDYGHSEDGYLYLAMELLEGQELSNTLRNEGALDPQRAVKIARQVCKSIGEAHELGLVHRDLKPDNIFLCDFFGEKDFVKVLDFGIAKFMEEVPGQESLTQTGFICGTPLYIAPEQALGRPVSPRTDLYSLGAILYELLSGSPPFRAETPIAIVMRHIHDQPGPMQQFKPDLLLPPELEQLVFAMLQKDPRSRPPSAQEVGLILEDLLSSGILAPAGGRRRAPTVSGLQPLSPSLNDDATRMLPQGAAISDGLVPIPVGTATSPSGMPPLPGEQHFQPTMAIAPGSVAGHVATGISSVGGGPAPAAQRSKRGLWMAAAALVVLSLGGVGAAVLGGGGGAAETVPTDRQAAAANKPGKARSEANKPKAGAADDAPEDDFGDEDEADQDTPGAKAADGAAAGGDKAGRATVDKGQPGDPAAPVEAVGPPPIEVTLKSDPEGAEVLASGALLGNAPVTVKLSTASPTVELTLKLRDHKDRVTKLDFATLSRTGQTQVDMTLSLEREAPAVTAQPTPTRVKPRKTVKKKKTGKDWSSWD